MLTVSIEFAHVRGRLRPSRESLLARGLWRAVEALQLRRVAWRALSTTHAQRVGRVALCLFSCSLSLLSVSLSVLATDAPNYACACAWPLSCFSVSSFLYLPLIHSRTLLLKFTSNRSAAPKTPRRWRRPKPTEKAQTKPPRQRGRERERQQGTGGTSPRRNRPAPAHTPATRILFHQRSSGSETTTAVCGSVTLI